MSSQTTSKDRSLAHARNTSVAARIGAPNPQGKGLVGFLLDWDYSSPQAVVAKRPARLLADYFTSLLVLTSSFKFKPVFNKDYYLYREDDDWRLSLISPDEWDSDEKRRSFVGTCVGTTSSSYRQINVATDRIDGQIDNSHILRSRTEDRGYLCS